MLEEKLVLEIPVKFINNEQSPGLKRGGVLNIVRRKVELKCPTESIPKELVVDLEGLDIGSSIKISAIKLPENVDSNNYRKRLCNCYSSSSNSC